MRIDDFPDVQDLMKVRDAHLTMVAELDDKLRALGVVVPKPPTDFDLAVARLQAHGGERHHDESGQVGGPYHPDFTHLYIRKDLVARDPNDGLFADYDAGVPIDAATPNETMSPLFGASPLLGVDAGFALRDGEIQGTAEIVLRGDGVQKGLLVLGPRKIRAWLAKLAEISGRGV